MSEGTHLEQEHPHISNSVYLIVGGFLIVLTAMEITVAYIHALRPVMVPILVILAMAKFALIAMFFMHLRYEKWAVNTMFLFPLTIALGVFLSLMGLFLFLSHHAVGPAFGYPLFLSMGWISDIHPSVAIGIAVLIAMYVGAATFGNHRVTSRHWFWFVVTVAMTIFTLGPVDEWAEQRCFTMHMLQHFNQTFVIPPLMLLAVPASMLRPWVLSRWVRPIRGIFYPAGDRVPDFHRGICRRAQSSDLQPDVPQRERPHRDSPRVYDQRRHHVVADPQSAA